MAVIVSVSGSSLVEGTSVNDPNFLSFAITLSEAATSNVTVGYRLLSGTAQAGSDVYDYFSGTQVTFSPGQISKTVTYRITGDTVAESDEAVVLEIFSVSGGAALAGNTSLLRATGWVLDDDGAGNKLALYTSQPVIVEGDAGTRQANFEVSLSRPAPGPLALAYTTVNGSALAGQDYIAASGTLNFVTGQTSASVVVDILGDTTPEPSDFFTLAFEVPNTIAQAALGEALILDDDAGTPTVSVTGASNFEGTSVNDPNFLSFAITLSEAATSNVTVGYRLLSGTAQAGSDVYDYFSGTQVTFLPGETSKTVSYRIDADSDAETDEAVVLEAYTISAGNARFADGVSAIRATGWVLDDDGSNNKLALFVENSQIVEGVEGYNRDAAVVVRLSRPHDSAISLAYSTADGTAIGGSDYTAVTGTLEFRPRQTSATLLVPVVGDALNESDETFTVTITPTAEIGNGTAGATGTITILDGDRLPPPAPVSMEAGANVSLVEGATLTRGVLLSDGFDNGAAGWTYTIDYGDGTVVNGSLATLNLSLNHAYGDGPAARLVSVTVTDVAGESASDSFVVNVNNVAPTIALAGAGSVVEDAPYSLTLGAITDPGTDTVSSYVVRWGDGTDNTYAAGGIVSHAYANPGNYTIRVDLVDEDGVHANAGARTVQVDDRPLVSGQLTLPATLAPGEEGLASYSYVNISGATQPGLLVLVQSDAALLRDPLTGLFTDSLLLIGRGDGQGGISINETGVLDFVVKQANVPLGRAGVTVSVVAPDNNLDTALLDQALRPSFVSDAGWQQIYANFLAEAGGSTNDLIRELSENSALLADLGAEDSSGAAALSFELEQAGDFGSIVERNTSGSLGEGWAFIGDVKLDIGANGDVAWRGSTDLEALFSLNASTAAYYTVSSSVGVSAGLGGWTSSVLPANRPVFVKDIDGSYATSTAFDGNLIKTANGYEVHAINGGLLRFGDNGQLQVVVSATGREVLVTHDAQGRITGFAGEFNNTLTIVRDATGRAVEMVDEYGISTTFTYAGDQLTQVTGTAGTASFGYTADGDLTSATRPGGPTIGFQYDTQGRLVGIQQAGHTAATIAYNSAGAYTWTSAEGQQTNVQLAPGGIASEVSAGGTTAGELVYDASGKLVGAQLAGGSQLQFGIDDQGRLLSVTDPTGATIRYAYTDDSTRPSSFTDATGTTRQFSYDNNGRLVEAIWGDGSSLQFNYDAQGQITGYTNRRGDTTTYDYDANGKLVSRIEAGGETVYLYDSLGRVVSATSAAGTPGASTTQIGYDSANRVTHIGYPDGRSLDYAYDAAGRRTAMTDQDGNVQSYSYDAAGRLAAVSFNGSQIVAYSYDGDGRLTAEANGNGTTTTYSYDARGLLTAIVNLAIDGSESSAYHYSYDAAGQRVGMQTPHGTWAYVYDIAGQLTSAQFNVNATGTAAGLSNKSLTYAYAAAGNRTSVTEDGVQTAYISNALNQYTQVGDTTYTYDAAGNQVSKTVNGETWTYVYNTNNRLVQITGPQGEVTQYAYDAFGNRSAMIEGGVRTEFLVDPFALGMGSPVAEYSGGQRVASYLYGLNAIAQQTSTGTYFFEGDAVGSVTGVTGAGGTLANAYMYDPFGRQMLEVETVINRLEFNGLFGVEEIDAGHNFMRARIYDAAQGRFSAEDPIWLGGDVANLYRFAANNPISLLDPSGLLTFKDYKSIADPLALAGIAAGTLIFIVAGTPVTAAAAAGAAVYGGYSLISNAATVGYGFGSGDNDLIRDGAVGLAFDAAGFGLGNVFKGAANASRGSAWDFFDSRGFFKFDSGSGHFQRVEYWRKGFDQTFTRLESLAELSATGLIEAARVLLGFSDGDPHLRTFDGLSYDFQAAGEFVLARGTGLEIQSRQEPWGNSNSVSVNTAVAMRVGDAVVGLYKDQPNPLNINGEWVQIANGETISVGGGSIYHNGVLYIITDQDGDGIWARVTSSYINVRAFVNNARANDVAGLLGNNDGNNSNDLALPNGTVLPVPVPVTQLYGQFADTWRVTDQTTLFVYGDGESTATYTDRSFPSRVVRLQDLDPAVRVPAEQVALNVGLVPGTWEFESAVLDIALTNDNGFADGLVDAPTNGTQPVPVVLQLPPNALVDEAATREDETVVIDVLANDSDPENDPLTLVSATVVNGGTASIVNGQLEYTPAPNFHGTAQLRYSVSDGAGNLTTGAASVEVAAVNDAPTAIADSYTTRAGQPLLIAPSLGLLHNDIDLDGDSLTVLTHNAAVNGTLVVDPDGALRYTPNAGFAGVEVIEYRVSDGTVTVTGNVSISVVNAVPTLSITGNTNVSEGDLYTLSVVAADDDGNPFTITVDWGSGEPLQTVTDAQLATLGGMLTHIYADDEDGTTNSTPRTITVIANDGIDTTSAQTQVVNVLNVAPTAAVTGVDTVNEGSVYTLNVGAVTEPGTDTRTAYSINWGDGATDNFTAAQWAAVVGGNFTHTYADGSNGGTARTIIVSATDEDGTFTLGSKTLTVNNVAPSLTLTGNNASNEGASYTLNIVGSDPAEANDPLSYDINWGDGSAVQTLTAAQLAALSGNVTHVFADDQDGPVNSTARTISVTVNDGDGGSTNQTKVVDVNNVAPTLALTGAGTATQNQSYTLTLGAIADPGTDTVTSYLVDWGDGSSNTYAAGGNVTHTYSTTGNRTIIVNLVDEDGTHNNAGTLAVQVNAATPTVSLEAGADATLSEGQALIRTINFSDGQDNGAPGWSYSIDYGDGTVDTGTTATMSLNLNHVYADGNASRTVAVTVTDVAGESASDSFTVNVNNVAPTASVTGANTVNEGSLYTLNVGAVTDPGTDTRTAYSINWGDGVTDNLTAAQWAAAAGNFTHTYADGGAGGTARTITVSTTDEDGTFTLGSKNLTVNNVAPSLTLTGNNVTNEGATYTLTIVGSDPAGANDPLTYSIDWNDGTAVQNLTAAQLAALSGNVTHIFADDQDGPVNSTPRTISVTVNDADGGSTNQTKVVDVNNVAPTISATGAPTATAGVAYSLTLANYFDPGIDALLANGISVNWGDGIITTYNAPGVVTHTYAAAGNSTIRVSLTDEDGTYTDVSTLAVQVNGAATQTVRIGDAPVRETGTNKEWTVAWTNSHVSIVHKADYTNAAEAYTPVKFTGALPNLLSGNDIFSGDLGVSGQSEATSTVRQEIDGREALRFNLDQGATGLTLFLNRFFSQDDGSGFVESGRVRLLDAGGALVGEQVFRADNLGGTKQVTVNSAVAFTAVEINAGTYNGANFAFGGYANPDGSFGSSVTTDVGGVKHGSDFILDAVEFQLPILGVPA